jgi:hypothetical protein
MITVQQRDAGGVLPTAAQHAPKQWRHMDDSISSLVMAGRYSSTPTNRKILQLHY